jgi:hypothetical protein
MSRKRALSVCATLVVLAGCSAGGSQPVIRMQEPTERNSAAALNVDSRQSWMASDSKRDDLLYVSDTGTNDVYAYSYPQGKLKGTLTGFDYPAGECVDNKGDVWITNGSAGTIVEYAHGGTTPIDTLSLSGQDPIDCSIDPTTGNLAVSNIVTKGGGAGSVSIFPNASGSPANYPVTNMSRVYFLTYDASGNLFADGSRTIGNFLLAELRKGGNAFTQVTSRNFGLPGAILWDGKYLAIGTGDGLGSTI